MKVCGYNGAEDAGEDRFDPRYDCQAEAVWHVLVTSDFAARTHDGGDDAFSCEDHWIDPDWIIELHRIEESCGRPGTTWRLSTNRCRKLGAPA